MTDTENLPALPEKWCWTRLGEITGPSNEKAEPLKIQEAKYVGLEHIEKDTGKLSGYGSSKEVKSTKNIFHKGDVLYGKLRPYLNKVYFADFDGVCSTDILVFPNKINLDNKFISLRLLNNDFVKFANINVNGVQHPRVNFKTLAEFSIALPPLPEQHRIVQKIEELFTDLDAGVKELEKAKVQVKNYRQTVLKAAVEGKLVPIEAELTGKERKNSIQDNNLSECWIWTTIGQITESLDHMRIPVNKKEREKRVGDIPYYGANGQVSWIDNYIFDEPLVLVVEDETFIGRQKPFCYKITGKSWVNNHAHVLRPTESVDIDYLNYSLAYYPFTPLTTGTTGRKKLTKSVLISAPYKLPPLAEQHRIVSEIERRFSVIDQIEKTIDQSLNQAEKLRQSILKKAFEGRLVPQDPNDEPASVLLEKIKQEKGRAESRKKPGKGRKMKAETIMEVSGNTKQAELF